MDLENFNISCIYILFTLKTPPQQWKTRAHTHCQFYIVSKMSKFIFAISKTQTKCEKHFPAVYSELKLHLQWRTISASLLLTHSHEVYLFSSESLCVRVCGCVRSKMIEKKYINLFMIHSILRCDAMWSRECVFQNTISIKYLLYGFCTHNSLWWWWIGIVILVKPNICVHFIVKNLFGSRFLLLALPAMHFKCE